VRVWVGVRVPFRVTKHPDLLLLSGVGDEEDHPLVEDDLEATRGVRCRAALEARLVHLLVSTHHRRGLLVPLEHDR
jgi:hypothetical protein